jgi:hypothetical protein
MLKRILLTAVPSLGLLGSMGCDYTAILYGLGSAGGILNFYTFFADLLGV